MSISRLRLSNVAPLFFEAGDHAYLRFIIGGVISNTTKTKITGDNIEFRWSDREIVLSITNQTLVKERLEVDLRREIHCLSGVKDVLVGRTLLWCPPPPPAVPKDHQKKNSIQHAICIQTALRHGTFDSPISHLEFLMNTTLWSPDITGSLHQHKGPNICLDVFDDDCEKPGEHLGRLVLCGSQIRELSTIIQRNKQSSIIGTSIDLPLRPRSARESEIAATKVRGTISISLIAARSLDFLCASKFLAQSKASAATLFIEKSAVTKESLDIVGDILETIVTTAWNSMQSGRCLVLHVVNGSGLFAPKRQKEKEQRDARSALLGSVRPGPADSESKRSVLPNGFCVVRWNGLEIGHTLTCPHTHAPIWGAQMPLSPSQTSDNNTSPPGLVLEVYDDNADESLDRQLGANGNLLGRLTLSLTQLWELRRIIRLRIRRKHVDYKKGTISDIKVNYSLLRHHSSKQRGPDNSMNVAVDDMGEKTSESSPRVVLSMSDMAAAELPDTTLFARVFGRLSRAKQTPYIVVRLWNIETQSSTIKHGGTCATWKHESIEIRRH